MTSRWVVHQFQLSTFAAVIRKHECKSSPCSKTCRRPQQNLSTLPSVPWRSWCELWPLSSPEHSGTAPPMDCLGMLRTCDRWHALKQELTKIKAEHARVPTRLYTTWMRKMRTDAHSFSPGLEGSLSGLKSMKLMEIICFCFFYQHISTHFNNDGQFQHTNVADVKLS